MSPWPWSSCVWTAKKERRGDDRCSARPDACNLNWKSCEPGINENRNQRASGWIFLSSTLRKVSSSACKRVRLIITSLVDFFDEYASRDVPIGSYWIGKSIFHDSFLSLSRAVGNWMILCFFSFRCQGKDLQARSIIYYIVSWFASVRYDSFALKIISTILFHSILEIQVRIHQMSRIFFTIY